jgi:rhodanese-related sulfurtransferase
MFKDSFNITHIYGTELLQNSDISVEQIVDIREPFEITICNIPGTLHIPMYTLISNYERLLDKNKPYYILCHTGQRSYSVTDYLSQKGYNIINIIGGIASIDEYNVPY